MMPPGWSGADTMRVRPILSHEKHVLLLGKCQ
jgi:hypothetical protein